MTRAATYCDGFCHAFSLEKTNEPTRPKPPKAASSLSEPLNPTVDPVHRTTPRRITQHHDAQAADSALSNHVPPDPHLVTNHTSHCVAGLPEPVRGKLGIALVST